MFLSEMFFLFQGDSGGPLHIDGERGFMETVGKS
jgi:hypothetical protein